MKIRKSEKPKSARQLCNGEMKRFACKETTSLLNFEHRKQCRMSKGLSELNQQRRNRKNNVSSLERSVKREVSMRQ